MTTLKLQGNASGAGSATVLAPNTGSARTITLPDADLTIPATNSSTTLTTQGDTLYRDGSGIQRLAKGTAGQVLKMNSGATAPEWGTDVGGKILQIVHDSDTATVTASGTILELLNVSITPASTGSKILIMASGSYESVPSSNAYGIIYLYRGDLSGTQLFTQAGGVNTGSYNYFPFGINYIDSPSTDSAVTYTTGINRSSSGTSSTSTNGTKYTLIAMEIGA